MKTQKNGIWDKKKLVIMLEMAYSVPAEANIYLCPPPPERSLYDKV